MSSYGCPKKHRLTVDTYFQLAKTAAILRKTSIASGIGYLETGVNSLLVG
jgi:hypothetical protein